MTEILNGLVQVLANSNNNLAAYLTTVVGLALFLKLIAIPLLKVIGTKFNIDISGNRTVVSVYIIAIVVAIVCGLVVHGTNTILATLLNMFYVGITSASTAIGLNVSAKTVTGRST